MKMANRVNQWLLKRLLYVTSLYFVLSSTQQPAYTSMLYQLGYLMSWLELPFGWSLLLTMGQILLIVFASLLVVVLGLYVGFRRVFRAGGRVGRLLRRGV